MEKAEIGTTGTPIRSRNGAWVASAIGAEQAFAAATWQPQGGVAFASSDIAPADAGWFEGAVLSGEQAAAALAET